MAIGVRFDSEGFDPVERIRQLVDAALEEYSRKLEPQLQALRDAGIAPERISIVTRSDCADCRGAGYTVRQEISDATHMIEIRECSTCPGICVDGVSMRTTPMRWT